MLKRFVSAARLALSVSALAGSMAAFYSSPFAGALPLLVNHEPESITRYRLTRLSSDDIEKEIRSAVAGSDYSDAQDLVRIGEDLGHELPPELVATTVEPTADAIWRNSSGFAQGFMYGEVDSVPSIFGAVAADYVVFGDVRDAYTEGGKLLVGSDYDSFTLGASLFGIATLAPGSGAFDAGASILKNANKARKLSVKLSARLAGTAKSAIDVDALRRGLASMPAPKVSFSGLPRLAGAVSALSLDDVRRLDFSKLDGAVKEAWPIDATAIRRQFDGVLRPGAVDEIRIAADAIGDIQANGGIRSVFRTLEHADNPAELASFKSLAKGMGDRTAAVIRLFGKGAIWLGDLIYEIVAVVAFAVLWSFGAVSTVIGSMRGLRRLVETRLV